MTAVTSESPTPVANTPQTGVRPGRVDEVSGDRALLDFGGDLRAWADPAMAVRYTPVAGDELLAATDGDRFWIIGVIRGQGDVALTSLGDVEVRSLAGTLRLGGTDAVELETERLSVFASTIETVAKSVRETLGSFLQTVTGRRLTRAGSDYRVVEGISFERSERSHAVSTKETRIDGSTVHLG
ncbi:MAG: hypothetical protein AAGI53_10265 [Planctomycetota bacterium]